MEWRRGEAGAVSQRASCHVLIENEYPSFSGTAPRRERGSLVKAKRDPC